MDKLDVSREPKNLPTIKWKILELEVEKMLYEI